MLQNSYYIGNENNRYITIDCKNMSGSIDIVKSKSILHRYLICSYLSGDIKNIMDVETIAGLLSDDIKATKECLVALHNKDLTVLHRDSFAEDCSPTLLCKESGTTLRFILPLIAALGRSVNLVCEGSLMGRPISGLVGVLNKHGADISVEADRIKVKGSLNPGVYEIPGNMSSQYISGLLFAISVLDGDSRIVTIGRPKSEPYIELTRDVMSKFGINTERNETKNGVSYSIVGDRKYIGQKGFVIEGDWSSGGMWLVANEILGDRIDVRGLDLNSLQGDRILLDILNVFNENELSSNKNRSVFNLGDYPDIVPAVALRAIFSGRGRETVIANIGTLRYKESDRLSAIQEILSMLGGSLRIENDSLIIQGSGGSIKGTEETIDVRNDHRMAMLAAMTSTITDIPVTINNAGCVNKSYPSFWKDIQRLGGRIDIL